MKRNKGHIPLALAVAVLLSSNYQSLAQQTWKIAVLTDVHLNPLYQPNITRTTYCQIDKGNEYTNDIALFGRIGCDPPELLLDRFLQRLNESEKPDILFMPGDFLGHAIPLPSNNNDTELFAKHYRLMNDTHAVLAQKLREKLPETFIVPSLGNNDWIYHYQSPYEDMKAEFFETLFAQWFTNQPKNSHLVQLDQMKQTFLKGGYYRMEFGQKLAVLSLNTLMWNQKNEPSR